MTMQEHWFHKKTRIHYDFLNETTQIALQRQSLYPIIAMCSMSLKCSNLL